MLTPKSNEDSMDCICGSGRCYEKCCKKYFGILGVGLKDIGPDKIEPLLIEWNNRYGTAINSDYMQKTFSYIFRTSIYLDSIVCCYMPLGYPGMLSDNDNALETVDSIKHNILLSLLAAFSCNSQGLFLQGGTLLRSAVEDSFVLLDISINPNQMEKVLKEKYTTSNLLSRIKNIVPKDLLKWYGYFSANYSHFGPLHPAPYMPRACNPENWVIGIGIENLLKGIITYHIVLERIYYPELAKTFFWKLRKSEYVFNENNKIYGFYYNLIKETIKKFPPNNKIKGFARSEKTYRIKK